MGSFRCRPRTTCMMANSANTSKWLVHCGFLILHWNSRLRSVRSSVLRVFFNWLIRFIATIHRSTLLIGTCLHFLLATVDPYTTIWPAWLFQVFYFLVHVRLSHRDEWVLSRFLRTRGRWYIFRRLNGVGWLRLFGDNRFWSALFQNYLLQLLVLFSQLLNLQRNLVERVVHTLICWMSKGREWLKLWLQTVISFDCMRL